MVRLGTQSVKASPLCRLAHLWSVASFWSGDSRAQSPRARGGSALQKSKAKTQEEMIGELSFGFALTTFMCPSSPFFQPMGGWESGRERPRA